MTEYFLIATGTSPRQMRTAIDEIRDLGKAHGFAAWRQDGYESAKWIVLDCVSVVVHLFDQESRDFYDLELLWGDSPRIDWRSELGLPADFAASSGMAEVPGEDEEDAPEEHASVVVELPDESTGSNSVEFVEVAPPPRPGEEDHAALPSEVEEAEDTTAEERAMGPLSEVADIAARLDEEADAIAAETLAKPRRKPSPKARPAKKTAAGTRKPAKKAATKKPAKKPATKKATKKTAPRKKS